MECEKALSQLRKFTAYLIGSGAGLLPCSACALGLSRVMQASRFTRMESKNFHQKRALNLGCGILEALLYKEKL